MERTRAFIIEQQAQTATKLELLVETVGGLSHTVGTFSRTVETLSRTVETLSRKVDRNADGATALLAIAEIHEREITELRQPQAEAQSRADERLNALINLVERHIGEGRDGKA